MNGWWKNGAAIIPTNFQNHSAIASELLDALNIRYPIEPMAFRHGFATEDASCLGEKPGSEFQCIGVININIDQSS